jgi:hypothetical protein
MMVAVAAYATPNLPRCALVLMLSVGMALERAACASFLTRL